VFQLKLGLIQEKKGQLAQDSSNTTTRCAPKTQRRIESNSNQLAI
jgi:hypothetical protein